MPVSPVPYDKAVAEADFKEWSQLQIDFDADRDKVNDLPATDEALERNRAVVERFEENMRGAGITAVPLREFSGNGHVLRYAIDPQPNSAKFKQLVREVISTFRLTWGCENIDASKVLLFQMRVPGTLNRKGKREDAQHPYRRAQLLNKADGSITRAQLEALATLALKPEKLSSGKATDFTNLSGWLAQHNLWFQQHNLRGPIEITDRNDKPATKYILDCPFKDHRNGEKAYIIGFNSGGATAGCVSSGCKGRGFKELRDLIDPGWQNRPDPFSAARTPESKATKLYKHILETYKPEFSVNPDGNTFITLTDPETDRRETHQLQSKDVQGWLRGAIGDDFGILASADITAVDETLAARASKLGTREQVFLRTGVGPDGTIYIDGGSSDWSIFEISARAGIRTISYAECPIKFQRSRNMQELPEPAASGDISPLWRFVTVLPPHRPLALGWMLYAMVRPDVAHPHLVINGDEGTGKTWTARFLKECIDPGELATRPKDERDLIAAVRSRWIMGFDNNSALSQEMSDLFCALSTGAMIEQRALYSNFDTTGFSAVRPAILNGIPSIASASDLLRRCWLLETDPSIKGDETRYIAEDELMAQFRLVWPGIFRALLDGVVAALRSEAGGEKLQIKPNDMLAAMRFACRAMPYFGFTADDFISAYDASREKGQAISVDSKPVNGWIIKFVQQSGKFVGTAKELLDAIVAMAREARDPGRLPTSAESMSHALRRLRPALGAYGIIAVEPGPSERPKNWTLTYEGKPEVNF
jgi:hypothetical protein